MLGIEYATHWFTTKLESNVHSGALPGLPRILIADDDSSILEWVSLLLRTEGFLVEEATDGADVIPLLALGSPPNLVISDVQMPGMSGLAVLSYIKSHHSSVPVILMTALATEHLRETARANGAAAVLAKPFSSLDLSKLVARHIRTDG